VYPASWNSASNLLWKVPLPGKGCSTPIVWAQRIFLTAPTNGQDAALAFDWSGRPLWQHSLGPERAGKHQNGSGANPSPATDGKGVFVYFKSGNLAAFDLDGSIRWRTNLADQFGKDTLFWDYGSSPVLTAKDVVLALMRHGDSWLLAFDKNDGTLHWKVPRDYPTPAEGDNGYATPLAIRHQGREALLVWGATHLTAQDAADGKVIWDCAGFNPGDVSNWPAVASPVVAGDVVILAFGRGERLFGVKLGGSGDVTATHHLWVRKDTGAFVPTPAECNGRVYLLRDAGEIVCIEPASGKTLWRGSLPASSSKYYASPLVADGKIYAAREDGIVFVARSEGEFKVLAENNLGERLIASPVPVAGRLLFRGEKHLICIGSQ
jgi:outer membrane protein assembly factor BamB